MPTALKELKIDTNLLKIINKIAKDSGTDEDNVMKKALEKGLEVMGIEEEYDCEVLVKELNRRNDEIESGKGVKVEVDKLEEHFGL
jgi:hypothetical protein